MFTNRQETARKEWQKQNVSNTTTTIAVETNPVERETIESTKINKISFKINDAALVRVWVCSKVKYFPITSESHKREKTIDDWNKSGEPKMEEAKMRAHTRNPANDSGEDIRYALCRYYAGFNVLAACMCICKISVINNSEQLHPIMEIIIEMEFVCARQLRSIPNSRILFAFIHCLKTLSSYVRAISIWFFCWARPIAAAWSCLLFTDRNQYIWADGGKGAFARMVLNGRGEDAFSSNR